MARTLLALTEFVQAGIGPELAEFSHNEDEGLHVHFPLWFSGQNLLPQKSNAFGYLNLFGMPKDDETEMLEDRDDRRRVFDTSFRPAVEMGLEGARKEGGEVGRAAAALTKALRESGNRQND